MEAKATLALLNDLIAVNGERIWSYQAVLDGPVDRADEDLRRVFEEIIIQGQRLQEELEVEYVELAHDLPAKMGPTGAILRTWNVLKATFPKKEPMPINEFFDKGERAILKAYRYAEEQQGLADTVRRLITKQHRELSSFYNHYK